MKKQKISWLKKLTTFTRSSHVAVIIAAELLIGVVVCVASLLLFFHLTGEIVEPNMAQFDVQVSQRIYALRSPFLTSVMTDISFMGADGVMILAALVSILLLLRQHRKEAVLFILTLIMGVLLNIILKDAVHRPRPHLAPLVMETSYSFPSGHTMNAFLFYSLLIYLSYHFFHKAKLDFVVSVFALTMIFLVGFSRVYLGVHYPTDVIGGYIVGLWWLACIMIIDKTLVFFRLFKASE